MSGYGHNNMQHPPNSQRVMKFGYNHANVTGEYNPRYHFKAAQVAGFNINDMSGQSCLVYIGNLHPGATGDFFAFVEFQDAQTAIVATEAMNNRLLLEREMKVTRVIPLPSKLFQPKLDTSNHFHVFVGDLSPEVSKEQLKYAFAPFGEITDIKIIVDQQTQKPKGYGFVSYAKKEEADEAIEKMNGEWLGTRAIRTNYAKRKFDPEQQQRQGY
ncbi:hypothetical protein M3Y97_00917200 [Aphelenchoides bicaudatus]|nr:hypothetical protein M3Y97_00917200 [Aphelenchoides bicaudatus]